MSNFNSNFNIGERVNVTLAKTVRDPRTHNIVVKHSNLLGKIESVYPERHNLGVIFDNGEIREVHDCNVQKVHPFVG